MKRRYVAALLALSISLTGIAVPIERYFSTEMEETTNTSEITELLDSTEMVEETENIEKNEQIESVDVIETTESEQVSETTQILENTSETNSKADEIVNIPDEVLRAEIVDECDSNNDGVITKSEMETLTYLNVSNSLKEVSNLTGIEYAVNLKKLTLTSHEIADISALKELTNLTTLNLYNNEIADISALKELTNLTSLDLYNNQIADISALKELTNLTSLDLHNNQIADISPLATLKELLSIPLSNNQITDISALTKLEKLMYLDLSNNQITSIPKFSFYNKMFRINLEENPLQNIENAKVLLDVKFPKKIKISASSKYVTPEMQFDNFFDTSERKMYVGNQMPLELEKIYFETDENVKISYKSNDEEIVSINAEGWMLANKLGSTTITAICGNIQKTFIVTVLAQEEAVKESSEKLPTVTTGNLEDTAGILDAKGLLWSVNTNKHIEKMELVEENVKDYYIAEVVYSNDRFSWWSNYIVLNKENTLLEYKKSDENAEYEKKVLAENVKNYTWKGYPTKVFTNDGDVIFFKDKKTVTYANLGTECVFKDEYSADYSFLILNGSTAICYSGDEKMAELEDVVEIGLNKSDRLSSDIFFARKSDGTTAEYISGKWVTYEEGSIKFPIQGKVWAYSDSYYIIDAENTLWLDNEKIAENVTYVNDKVYLLDDDLYSFEKHELILEDVKEYCAVNYNYLSSSEGKIHYGTYYLTTDGIVWEVLDAEEKNQILNSVVDIVATTTGTLSETNVYMVRQDGSVWKYRDYMDKIGIATMLLDVNTVVMGDISGDGQVKINDMLTILHGISGSQTLSESQQIAADIDKDGKVTVRDMLRIMHYISGASSTL